MFRRILQIVSTVGLVVAAGVLVARAAEPAVRPVLYPPPPTTVAPPTTVTLPPTTTTTTSTTIAPVAAVDEFGDPVRSEEHTSELQSRTNLVCRLLLEKKKKKK